MPGLMPGLMPTSQLHLLQTLQGRFKAAESSVRAPFAQTRMTNRKLTNPQVDESASWPPSMALWPSPFSHTRAIIAVSQPILSNAGDHSRFTFGL